MIANEAMALDWDVARHIAAGTSDEPLVPAKSCKHWIARPVYFQNGLDHALPEIWVRQGVYDRLIIAAEALPSQYRLVLLDGWRPKSIQKFLFEKIRSEVALSNPSLTDDEVAQKTLLFAARPSDDPARPSPHITGGAVDVTLADEQGTLIEMGSAFDEASDRSWTAALVPSAPSERRQHLIAAMDHAGFTNLPSEWWHFDYGNWVWAWFSKKPGAFYGPTQPPIK